MEGSYNYKNGNSNHFPGCKIAAGFLHGNLNNLSTSESLNKGREMSSRVIQQIGARL